MSDPLQLVPPNIETLLAHEQGLTVGDLMDTLSPEGRALLDQLSVVPIQPGDIHKVFALLYGSLAVDAEMREPEYTFEDRLRLFGVHARTSYTETAAFMKTQPKDGH